MYSKVIRVEDVYKKYIVGDAAAADHNRCWSPQNGFPEGWPNLQT